MNSTVFQRGNFGWSADGATIPAWWYAYEADGLRFEVGPFRSQHDATEAALADDDVAPFDYDGDATQAGQ
jgi:hypothetical protein